MSKVKTKIIESHRWLSLGVGDRGEPFVSLITRGVFVVPITDDDAILMQIEPSVMEKNRY